MLNLCLDVEEDTHAPLRPSLIFIVQNDKQDSKHEKPKQKQSAPFCVPCGSCAAALWGLCPCPGGAWLICAVSQSSAPKVAVPATRVDPRKMTQGPTNQRHRTQTCESSLDRATERL